MNKQAITFLTLFSLILVLSIYYILLPPEADRASPVHVKEATSTSQIDTLQGELNAKRESIISESNEAIASSGSTNEAISRALETIAQTKETKNKEKEVNQYLKELGYKNGFVEIQKQTVKVVVEKKNADKGDANKIIKTLLNKLGDGYQIEVKFI